MHTRLAYCSIKILFTLLLCNGMVLHTIAQQHNTYFSINNGEQLGASVKLTAEIGDKKNPFAWRIGVSGGAGAFLGRDWLYPSLNIDLWLYHSGIGSKWPGDKKGRYADVEINVAYTLTGGFKNRMYYGTKLSPLIRNYPLYYFNTFNHPALQNPFNYSVSWGGNLIFLPSRKTSRFQQVGFLGAHVARVQLTYLNDGPPFFQPFGDKYDRLHTGSGYLTFHGNNSWAINLVEFGFNKFTGYSPNAYELSNKTGAIYIYYHDPKQQLYNKANIYLNVANSFRNWGISLNWYNYPKLDVQHKIHQGLFYPLHMVPYKPHFAVGALFYEQTTKIGLQ